MEEKARIMVPIDITTSMVKSGTTIPEPDASRGEVAWVSGATYAIANERTNGGSIWICTAAHSGRSALPGVDVAFWERLAPTNRMAPFDDYANTKAVSAGTLTYVIQPGFLNGAAIYGMEGSAYSITVKDSPTGSVVLTKSGDLYEQAAGFYELLFSPLLQLTQFSFDDIPIAPGAEVTVTITASPGDRVAIGSIKLGDWRQFISNGSRGGTEYGAQSERKTLTYRKPNADGTYKTIPRPNSRNIVCTVKIDAEQAMYADAILSEIIDTAVPFEATGLPRLGYLNTLGFVSATMTALNLRETSLNFKIEGNT